MPSQTHTKVIIAGGSISGLALANMLEQKGIDYLVLERHHSIAPDVGYSIGVMPHGSRILAQLKCYSAVQKLTEGIDPLKNIEIKDGQGKTVNKMAGASEYLTKR